MSFKSPREKLTDIMQGLGYVLAKDAFDFEDIGNTRLDKAFHIEQGDITPLEHGQDSVTISSPQTVRFYNKGNRETHQTMLTTLTDLDKIMNYIMDIRNRTDDVVNVMFENFSAVPHTDDNNDIVRGELTVVYQQIFCFQIN